MAIHAILPCHFRALREVVHFLIPSERLVSLALDVRAGPGDLPLLVAIGNFPETIVLKRIPNQSHVDPVIELEVVPPVLWLVRSQRHRIDIGSEDEILLRHDIINCLMRLNRLLEG